VWAFTEEVITPANFPATIDGEQYTEGQLKKKKALACRILTMAVSDNMVDSVAVHIDPALAWKALKDGFQSGD
jgi:hypothetical protein